MTFLNCCLIHSFFNSSADISRNLNQQIICSALWKFIKSYLLNFSSLENINNIQLVLIYIHWFVQIFCQVIWNFNINFYPYQEKAIRKTKITLINNRPGANMDYFSIRILDTLLKKIKKILLSFKVQIWVKKWVMVLES